MAVRQRHRTNSLSCSRPHPECGGRVPAEMKCSHQLAFSVSTDATFSITSTAIHAYPAARTQLGAGSSATTGSSTKEATLNEMLPRRHP